MQSSTRQFAPDLLKAIAIFGVVYIHSIWMVGENATVYITWIFRAAVPCFLMMFSYFMARSLSRQEHPWRYIGKRFLHILTVFIVWSLAYSLFREEWLMPTLLKFAIRHFGGGSWPGQFFFFILLQLIPLFPVLVWAYNRPALRIGILAFSAATYLVFGYAHHLVPEILLQLKMRPFFHSIPYVFAGIALSRGQLPRLSGWWTAAIVLIPLEFFILSLLGREHDAYVTPGVAIASILISTSVLQLRLNPPRNPLVSGFICFAGANTMTIFVANPLAARLLARFTHDWRPVDPAPWLEIPLSFLFASIVLVMCCGMAWLIKRIRLEGIIN
ncbi:acyltransferase [Puniceicoccales bacterium CK1056]|uniref:Acyltransferase n=1 Tax=Oceanipulchritudo coccoides TaxID=2706888 RepID=A0A6B2M3P3_9BACT|nr:acyltransferase [Oceanipulchritudo coccoides]NDV63036.1 acyltransferase [Oceanipulchritudo coccoides]